MRALHLLDEPYSGGQGIHGSDAICPAGSCGTEVAPNPKRPSAPGSPTTPALGQGLRGMARRSAPHMRRARGAHNGRRRYRWNPTRHCRHPSVHHRWRTPDNVPPERCAYPVGRVGSAARHLCVRRPSCGAVVPLEARQIRATEFAITFPVHFQVFGRPAAGLGRRARPRSLDMDHDPRVSLGAKRSSATSRRARGR